MAIISTKQFVHKPLLLEGSLNEVSGSGPRMYSTPEGIFPSVTTVVGFRKQEFFAEWRRKNPEESKRVLARGTKFHSLLEKYLNNEDLDYDNLHSVALETPLWSKILGLAGRTDCIAEYDGKLSIIDFKASTKEKRTKDVDSYFAQATAYSLMFQERTGIIIDNFAIMIACEDGLHQVFQDKPINHVKHLKFLITDYRKHHGKV
jgi:genome maintenance exonuclease 1